MSIRVYSGQENTEGLEIGICENYIVHVVNSYGTVQNFSLFDPRPEVETSIKLINFKTPQSVAQHSIINMMPHDRYTKMLQQVIMALVQQLGGEAVIDSVEISNADARSLCAQEYQDPWMLKVWTESK